MHNNLPYPTFNDNGSFIVEVNNPEDKLSVRFYWTVGLDSEYQIVYGIGYTLIDTTCGRRISEGTVIEPKDDHKGVETISQFIMYEGDLALSELMGIRIPYTQAMRHDRDKIAENALMAQMYLPILN